MLALLAVIGPVTAWYTARILWATVVRPRTLPCVCEWVPRAWSSILLRVAGVRVVLEHAEAIDPGRPQVLVVNHVSWFDVLALAAHLPGSYRFVAKKEIERTPLFGGSVRRCGHIYIDRHDRQKAVESLARARETLENVRPTIIMFPEGTRSRDGALQRFKKGAFVLAIQTGTEVVPAAVLGSRDVMRKGSLWIRPGTITVRFGDPIPVAALEVEDRDVLTGRAHAAVAALLAGET